MTEKFTLTIDGVALEQSLEEQDDWLPDVDGLPHYAPYKHQVEMRELIENESRFVAMNTTITGGGKTSSYVVPSMREDLFTIVIFPTNALTEDQYQTINGELSEYFPQKNVSVTKLTSDSMQETREMRRDDDNPVNTNKLSNSQQVEHRLMSAAKNDGPSFVLTNPDIFLGILRNQYSDKARQNLEMADMAVIDEFHNARPKGQASLVYAMDELFHRDGERCNLNQFVLLSATPNESVESLLSERFGRPSDENIYHRIDSKENSEPISKLPSPNADGYNPVMPQVETTFRKSRAFDTKKTIIDSCFQEISTFLQSGRSIVIVDGVAEVNDVYNALESKLDDSTRVEAISGLRRKNMDDKLSNADTLVANSTVEVGIDIGNVEQLVFTGFNASRFLQRFGRLRAGENPTKQAICFTKPDALLSFRALKEIGEPIPRDVLESCVKNQLSDEADPDLYRSEFAPVEMYRAIDNRAENMFDSAPNYRRRGAKIVQKHYFESTNETLREQDVQRMWARAQSPLGEAMQSYRQTSLTALVFDERNDCNDVKTYSIASLIRMADIEFLTWPEFKHRLRCRDIDPELYSSEKRYAQTYAWMHGYSTGEKLRNPHIAPTDQIGRIICREPAEREPVIMNDLEFTVENNDAELRGLGTLNKQLKEQLGGDEGTNIVGYPTEGHPAQVQTVYGLDEFFFTNPIDGLNGQYSLALGENAFYLYCHVQESLMGANQLYKRYNATNSSPQR